MFSVRSDLAPVPAIPCPVDIRGTVRWRIRWSPVPAIPVPVAWRRRWRLIIATPVAAVAPLVPAGIAVPGATVPTAVPADIAADVDACTVTLPADTNWSNTDVICAGNSAPSNQRAEAHCCRENTRRYERRYFDTRHLFIPSLGVGNFPTSPSIPTLLLYLHKPDESTSSQ